MTMTVRSRAGRVLAALVVIGAAVLTTGASTPPPSTTPPAFPDDADNPVRKQEYWLDSLGVREAWNTTRGKGQRIAIIDTGIANGPPEFRGAVADGIDVSRSGSPDGRQPPVGALDLNHGSWVASLAAGRGTPDGGGVAGVAPEAELLSVSISFSSAARVPFAEQVAQGIRWAVDNGADVINLSFTVETLEWDLSWDEAFQYAFDHDVVVVVAAGNRSSGTTRVGAPATIPGVLTVAGVDRAGRASQGASTQGITIKVAAPSEELVGVSADGRIAVWNGTSGAAPIVAGIAALVRAAHPDLDAQQVIERIVATAIPPANASADDAIQYGQGIVDAAAAVEADVPKATGPSPAEELQDWVRLHRRAAPPEPSEPIEGEVAAPEAVAPLPPAEEATPVRSALLPTEDTLRYGTVPLLMVTAPAILVALGVSAVVHRVRSARARRTPSITPSQGVPARERP